MLARDEWATGFVEHAARAPGAEALSEARWAGLRRDADALGFVGLLASLADPAPKVDPAVRDELVAPLDRDLRDALGQTDDVDLPTRFTRFLAAKGSRGPDLLAQIVVRVIHEVWSLEANRLGQEDVVHALDLVAWSSHGQDAREATKRLVRLSRPAARATLGHVPEQLELVHRLGQNEEVAWAEIDRRLHEFAPRVFAARLPAIVRYLLPDEPRVRLAIVAWARLRGVVFPRAQVIAIRESIVPEKPMVLAQALDAHEAARTALREADAASPVARAIERAFLGRVIPAPT